MEKSDEVRRLQEGRGVCSADACALHIDSLCFEWEKSNQWSNSTHLEEVGVSLFHQDRRLFICKKHKGEGLHWSLHSLPGSLPWLLIIHTSTTSDFRPLQKWSHFSRFLNMDVSLFPKIRIKRSRKILEEAAVMDSRFKLKVDNDDAIWDRLRSAAVAEMLRGAEQVSEWQSVPHFHCDASCLYTLLLWTGLAQCFYSSYQCQKTRKRKVVRAWMKRTAKRKTM